MKLVYSLLIIFTGSVLMADADLKPGDTAPSFRAEATGGQIIALSDFAGKWLVLYFYPKAKTPGCTKQGCSLRDGYDLLQAADAEVLGVSLDSVEKQEEFKEQYSFPFQLLADTDKTVAKAYDALMLGGLMTKRVTYIINPEGQIAAVIDDIDVNAHDEQVLNTLKQLQEI